MTNCFWGHEVRVVCLIVDYSMASIQYLLLVWMAVSPIAALLLPTVRYLHRSRQQQRMLIASNANTNPKHRFRLQHDASSKRFTSDMNDAEDDDGCEDEEECEIDWDSMPGFGETNEQEPATENLRNRLEMSWALDEVKDECDVFRPITCGGSPCRVCRTSGRMACRFCHGRTYNEHLNAVCPICDERGQEVCSNCRGSGWVADWTAWGTRPGDTNSAISSKLAP